MTDVSEVDARGGAAGGAQEAPGGVAACAGPQGAREVPVERRFRGTVRLATLHLWRVAHSTDIDEGFAEAHKLRMITDEHERFIRACFALDKQLEAGEEPAEPITMDKVNELQRCVLLLNTADPA